MSCDAQQPKIQMSIVRRQHGVAARFIYRLRSVGVYAALLGSYLAGIIVERRSGSRTIARRYMLTQFTNSAFRLIKLRVNLEGAQYLPRNRSVVVIFNHQSQADGLIIMRLFRDNFAAIGKQEIAKNKLFANAYKFAGVIPIDRQNSQSAIEAMQPLVDVLKFERRVVAIAPEGTRSKTPVPGNFKKGAFHVAMQAGVSILPVVLHNSIEIQRKGQFEYLPGTVEVQVLPEIDTSDWSLDSLDERVTDVRNLFVQALELGCRPDDGNMSHHQVSRVVQTVDTISRTLKE